MAALGKIVETINVVEPHVVEVPDVETTAEEPVEASV